MYILTILLSSFHHSFLATSLDLDIGVLLALLPEDICDLLLDIVDLSLTGTGGVGVAVVGVVVTGQTSSVGVVGVGSSESSAGSVVVVASKAGTVVRSRQTGTVSVGAA